MTLFETSEFQCHAMIRDVWNDKKVQACIKEHFVFCYVREEVVGWVKGGGRREVGGYCEFYTKNRYELNGALVNALDGCVISLPLSLSLSRKQTNRQIALQFIFY